MTGAPGAGVPGTGAGTGDGAGAGAGAAPQARLEAFATYLRRRIADAAMAPLAVVTSDEEVPKGTEIALVLGEADPDRLALVAGSSGLGCRFASDGFALLDRFDPAATGPVPEPFDVLAVVTTYNEADIAGGLLGRLLKDGLRVHVVDNWSSDGTYEIVTALASSRELPPGRLTAERFPAGGPAPHFELATLLGRVEEIAAASGADWVVHHDADEIREAPWPGIGLREALYAVERFGFNCVDHSVVNFVPLDDSFAAGDDLRAHFTACSFGTSPGHFLQQKAWKPEPGPFDMASSGGHEAVWAGRRVFPYRFLLRHYPIRSQAQGERKIFRERRARFSPAERARGWHLHYDEVPEGASLLGDPATLLDARDLDGPLLLERLSGAGLPGNPYPGEGPPPASPGTPATSEPPAAGGVADAGAALLVLRIQSVLYEPPPSALDRYVHAVGQAVRALTEARPEIAVEIALADCSAEATYAPDEVDPLRWRFTGTGVRALHYEHFGDNPGHGGAHARLLAHDDAHANLVLVLNPDTCVAPRLLVELLAAMQGSVAVVEARQLPLEHQKAYDTATGDTSWASGACSLVRRDAYDEIGGFDADTFFLYCDDVDLSWRMRLAGYRVVYQPSAVCFHDKRLSAEAAEQPGNTEVYHSGLARLLLMTKYSRPDLVGPQLDAYRGSPEQAHQEIAEEYARRQATGRLPAPIDADGLVADFSTYSYAPLRFDYAR